MKPRVNLVSNCLQMFGCGAVAQLVLSGGSHGMFLTVNFAFGFAATLGILVCGQVSGKHLQLPDFPAFPLILTHLEFGSLCLY